MTRKKKAASWRVWSAHRVAEQNETAKLWQVEDNPAAEESDENDELRIK